MTDFGKVTDYRTGDYIRQATPAEWRKTADAINLEGHPQGFWEDQDGRAVWVDGGPDAIVSDSDIRALLDAAGSAGDLSMVTVCGTALADTMATPSHVKYDAYEQCARVILDTRMEMA